jgi:hypothetical protein
MGCGSCAGRRAAAQSKKIVYEVTYQGGSKEEFGTYAQAKSAVRRKGDGSIRTIERPA